MLPRDILPLIFHLSPSLLILPTESCTSKALKFNYQLLKFNHIKMYKTTIVYQTTIKTGVDYNILGSYSCSCMCVYMMTDLLTSIVNMHRPSFHVIVFYICNFVRITCVFNKTSLSNLTITISDITKLWWQKTLVDCCPKRLGGKILADWLPSARIILLADITFVDWSWAATLTKAFYHQSFVLYSISSLCN